MTSEEITVLRRGDAVRITEPVGRHGSRVFSIILDESPSCSDLGVIYLTGTRVRADGTPDKRSKPGEKYAVNAAWVEQEKR